MMSDGMLRRDLRIETLADTLVPELALTHVVKLEASPGVYLTREDDGDWADLARATGGLAWYGTASADASHVADMARAFEPLVRPVTLDQVKESLPWWIEPSVLIFPDQLAEGTGASLLAVGAVALPWIELRAKSWHDTLRLPLSATGDDDGVWSALAFGDSAFFPSNPDDADLVALARRGGAVTPLTSYLVGQTEQPPIEHGGDASGFGRRARMSNCGGVQLSGRHPGNRKRWLEEKLRHAWYDCGGAMHAAQAHFETVQGEVVAVREVVASAGAAPAMASCLAESIWRIQLHEMFADDERSDWSIDATPIFHARFAP
jgi:hypothetical protein